MLCRQTQMQPFLQRIYKLNRQKMRAAPAYSGCVGAWMVQCSRCEGLWFQPQSKPGGWQQEGSHSPLPALSSMGSMRVTNSTALHCLSSVTGFAGLQRGFSHWGSAEIFPGSKCPGPKPRSAGYRFAASTSHFSCLSWVGRG